MATVQHVKLMYRGVPEDGFSRDVEWPAEVITRLHKRTGMDFDTTTLLVKGLQLVRGPHCTEEAWKSNKDQQQLQNWETEDYIVFENIYYGVYNDVIVNSMNQHTEFPVYICDKTKPHTRFFKAGLFFIVENARPEMMTTNCNGYTVRGYLLLQRKVDRGQMMQDSNTLSKELGHDLRCGNVTVVPRPSRVPLPPVVEEKKESQPVPMVLEEPLQLAYSRPTELFGIQFKSLLEARFATLLSHLGLEFTYEKSMFSLQSFDRVPGHSHTYHPDFYIKAMRLQVELKPHYPHLEELDLCEQLAQLGYDVVLFYGTEFMPLFQNYDSTPGHVKRHYSHQNAIRGMGWCGQTGKRFVGEAMFVDYSTHVTIECVEGSRKIPMASLRSPRLLAAFEAARSVK
jgi:hypothetical protein